MLVSAKDKRIKALNSGERGVKGLQPEEEALILDIVAALIAAPNLALVSAAHPSWRVHHHKPRKASSPWSADVTGNDRLYFYYNNKTHEVTGMKFGDGH